MTRKAQWMLVLFILTYLSIEWVYNQHLLLLIQWEYVSSKEFEWTERFGKLVTSLGITLMLVQWRKWLQPWKWFVSILVCYGFLSVFFHLVIQSIPDNYRHASYYASAYRQQMLSQPEKFKVMSDYVQAPWFEKGHSLSQFYVVLLNDDWKHTADTIKDPVQQQIKLLESKKKEYWKQYEKAEGGRRQLENYWDNYSQAMRKYNRYANTRYEARARKTFQERVGLPPGLDKDAFFQKVGMAYVTFQNKMLWKGIVSLNLSPVYGRDIPLDMNESAFYRYVDSLKERGMVEVAPTIQTIRQNKNSETTISLMVIPPIALMLSLISMFLNTIGLLVIVMTLIGGSIFRGTIARIGLYAIFSVVLAIWVSSSPVRLPSGWNQYIQEQSSISKWFRPVFKAQPLISAPTKPLWLENGMRQIYSN